MPTRAARAAALGLLAGLVSGLFGVGGGIIVVPGLVLWFGADQHRASGTSTATIVTPAAVAVLAFGSAGEVDLAGAAALFVGAGAGALTAARLLHHVPAVWLTRVFALVMAVASVRLLLT